MDILRMQTQIETGVINVVLVLSPNVSFVRKGFLLSRSSRDTAEKPSTSGNTKTIRAEPGRPINADYATRTQKKFQPCQMK